MDSVSLSHILSVWLLRLCKPKGQDRSICTLQLEIASSFYFVFWVIIGVGIASGLFEVLTGVSPLPQGSKQIKDTPFYFKAPWLHQYRYNPHLAWRARVIGGLRILLGLFFLFVTFLVGYFSLL